MESEITTAINYEAEFNNRARVPEHPQIMDNWMAASVKWRKDVAEARLDIPYGQTPRQCIDIFKPRKEKPGPIVLFIHGGYWQALGRESFSHMAKGANKHGVTVAVASYDLCPKVSVSEIIGQMRTCCAYLWKTYKSVENLQAQDRGRGPLGRRPPDRRDAGHALAGHRSRTSTSVGVWRVVDFRYFRPAPAGGDQPQ